MAINLFDNVINDKALDNLDQEALDKILAMFDKKD